MTDYAVANRPPATAISAALLTVLLAVVTCGGAIYFTFFYDEPAVNPGRVLFATAFLAINATAVAAAAGLLRGNVTAWRIEIGYAVWGVLFTLVKLIFWQEWEAATFGVLSLVLLALLHAPVTRRHVGHHIH